VRWKGKQRTEKDEKAEKPMRNGENVESRETGKNRLRNEKERR
jgi:hypothetical protein